MNGFIEVVGKVIEALDRAEVIEAIPFRWKFFNGNMGEGVEVCFSDGKVEYRYFRRKVFLGIPVGNEEYVISDRDSDFCMNHWNMLGDALRYNSQRLS